MKKYTDNADPTPSQEKYIYSLIYGKHKRNNLKKYFLRSQKYVLENDDFTKKPITNEEFEERIKNIERLDLSLNFLSAFESLKEIDKETYQTNCRFKLYRKGKAYIIANTFQTPKLRKKISKTFHFMPNGLPIKGRKRENKYRNKFEFSDYKLIDEGSFRQVFDEIRGSKISYRGKMYNFRIKYRGYGKNKKDYWIEMMRFRKNLNLPDRS